MGCGETRPKAALTRLALDAGRVVVDARRVQPGRGAYVCGADCLRRAVAGRALPRAFRRPVTTDVDTLELDG